MNRIEIVGLFTAMKELCKKKQYDSVETIVDAVLDEATTKKNSRKQYKESEETDNAD